MVHIIIEDDEEREITLWKRRTFMVAGCFVGALIILAFRLIEIEASLRAVARI